MTIVRARAPLRLGLAGGGTDLSPYCDDHGGAVLNATIDRYAYAFIEDAEDGRFHLIAPDISLHETFHSIQEMSEAQLILHAGVTRRMITEFADGHTPPLRITSYVDAPPGSGLGSSSALVVALVEAFAAKLSAPLGPYDIAHKAFEIERIDLRLAGGKQDQYAATFGGINFIEFNRDDRVIVNPLRVPTTTLRELETSLVICFSGLSRRSGEIIIEQQQRMTEPSSPTITALHQLKDDAYQMKDALLRGRIVHMAAILNRSWQAKKQLVQGISTNHIDTLHELAFAAGAAGGKVSGAGGGGFLMLIVPPSNRIPVIHALNKAGGNASAMHFTAEGAVSWHA